MTAADETVYPVVYLDQVQKEFPGPPPVSVLAGVDLAVATGEYISLLGPSGSGKSTLLNTLGLLDRPTGGRYYLDGTDTSELGEDQRSWLRGSRLGFVFQNFHLLPHRTVTENVMLSQIYNRTPRRERKERAVDALESVGLAHRLDFFPSTLSGGERQRVAIARAIVNRPSLLLADEPTGNLDQANTEQILELFAGLHASGLTLAVITHDLEVAGHASRHYHLAEGRLMEYRT